jgi:hypothetical protein
VLKDFAGITRIYIVMMAVLAVLWWVPFVGNRLGEQRDVREMRRAVVRVNKGSHYIGQQCPSERNYRPFQEGDLLLICPACKQAHHLDCWHWGRGKCYSGTLCPTKNNPRPLPETLAKSFRLPPLQ